MFFMFCLDNLIWRRSVYKAIIPKQCLVYVGHRLEVKLKKLKYGEDWKKSPWCDDRVRMCTYIYV